MDRGLGAEAAAARPSITQTLPLVGGRPATDGAPGALARQFGWDAAMVDHLLHRYGSDIRDIAEICDRDETMSRPLEHAPAYLRAEIAYAVSHEGALHLEDVMHRRTRMVYEYADEALAALPEVARIVAGELGWSDARRDEEVAAYTAVADAVAAAARTSDDAAAARARAAAPGVAAMSPHP